MADPRVSGILLHPDVAARPLRHRRARGRGPSLRSTSWRTRASALWQVLPLGPTGYGDSPYQCFSAFAGNPLLVEPGPAGRQGLLDAGGRRAGAVVRRRPRSTTARVIDFKLPAARRARPSAFREKAPPAERRRSTAFCAANGGLARRLRALHGAEGGARRRGLDGVGRRHPAARARRRSRAGAREHGATRSARTQFAQFLFFAQWGALQRRAAATRGIAHHGRHPDLRRPRQRGRLGAPRAVPPRRRRPPERRGRRAARLLQRDRPALGQSHLPLGRDGARRGFDWWVERFRADVRAGGPRAPRPLPRLRGLLGGPGAARRPP